jgi:glycosyltransferase involved in cell wall biosynthesis
MGLISPQKGIDTLLRAIAFWDPPAERYEFVIAGDGPELRGYQRLAMALKVSDRITWLGAVSHHQAPELFRRCHAFVLPSRHESFGVVLIEAMASGKPVIATRCGGPESIVNAENGLLVLPGSELALAGALREMASTWENYDADDIRADFEQRFSRKPVVSRLTDIYRSVFVPE